MASAMMMERTGMGLPGMGTAGLGATALGTPAGLQAGTSWQMVPRCTFKAETVQGGLRITCSCEDKVAATMVQNLCQMLQGGLCSCCATLNGLPVYTCNLTMGLCRCETTKDGVTVTCTSGDAKCAEMIQACCNCLSAMLKAGCTCCLLMNNTPVCCGC
jgi:hypothetical protein